MYAYCEPHLQSESAPAHYAFMTTKGMRRGARDSKKEAFWRRVVEGRAEGGLSVRAWCRRHRVRETSFYWWRRALARRDAEARRPVSQRVGEARLVPVRVSVQDLTFLKEPSGCLEIILPGARCIRVTAPVDRQALADVLEVLSTTKEIAAEAAAC